MSNKGEKLLAKARRKKAGWMPRQLRELYEAFGFVIRDGKGSHKNVSHPQFPDLRATYPEHADELGVVYIVTAVKNIDLLLERVREEADQDE